MILLALLLVAAPEVNLSLLRPASGSDGLLGVEGVRPLSDVDGPLELQLGLDAAWLPVRLPGLRVESRIGGWVSLHARLNEQFSLFAQLPATVRETGEIASTFGVGDIRVGVRHGFSPSLAAQLSVETATARSQTLTGDDRLAVEGLVSAAAQRGRWELLGNAYLRFRAPREVGPVSVGNELGLRGGAAWPFPRGRFYGEAELQLSLRQISQQAWPLEWRAGARYCVSDALAVDAALGTRLDDGLGAPSVRGVVAVRYTPAYCRPAKSAGPEPGMQDLVALLARERAERREREREQAAAGLLEPSEAAARDLAARTEATDLLALSEIDARLRAGALADEDNRDTDGDGVPDRLDNCPNEKGPPENHGCPKARKQLVILREDRIEILQRVYFATGKARIEKRSFGLLAQVAQVLQQHPDLLEIQVEGHTDDRGRATLNTALSQARAEAVVGYLIKRGVAAGRLTARGFGPSRPLGSNATAGGRDRNRRVEFHVLKRRVAREVLEVTE